MVKWSLKGSWDRRAERPHGSVELEGLIGQGSLKGVHGSVELEGLMGKWSLKGSWVSGA